MDLDQEIREDGAKILIIGVGGGGGNAVNRMIEDGIEGVDYMVANTDNQALKNSSCKNRIQLGEKLTKGLGAGSKPDIGKKAAEETMDTLKDEMKGYDMIFITAGMGGGTGTGASPVIAKIAKELGALTVAVVTMPFSYEGKNKRKLATTGFEELKENVDSIMVIPNDKISQICPKGTKFADALKKGNEILSRSVRSVTDLIMNNGIINLDFADIRTTMENKGVCHVGFGAAKGENRAVEAAKQAITSPLLETTVDYASNVLVNVMASMDTFAIDELDTIGEFIREAVGEDEDHESETVIIGSTFVESMGEELSVVVIATGIGDEKKHGLKVEKQEQEEKEDSDDLDLDVELEDSGSKGDIQNIDEVKGAKTSVNLEIPEFLRKGNRKK